MESPLLTVVRWRIHLRSAPQEVYRALSSAEGRTRFWAESADEEVEPNGDRVIRFRFSNGAELESLVLARTRPSRFQLSYFGGSTVTFELEPDGAGAS